MLARAIGIVATAGLGSSVAAADTTYKGYEQPDYVVEKRVGDVEIRRYAPQLLAEVTVRGSRDGALSKGFRALAGYIFGDNSDGNKIAMTVPVTQHRDEETWTVTFMVPKQWSKATLPTPNNAAVRFVERPGERLAVLQFTGLANAGRVETKGGLLRAQLERSGIAYDPTLISLFYDDPFTIPWRRRNEVAFSLN